MRAMVGNETLRRLGFEPKLTYGSMLYRAGPDQRRDTMSYCTRGNSGYINNENYDGGMLGHLWIELGQDLIDFSTGDWQRESEILYLNFPDGLERVEWTATPPTYLWQRAAPLKAAWKSFGSPKLGDFWYGPWKCGAYPDMSGFDFALAVATGQIDHNIERLRLRERVKVV
jgi:hypothetical protein